MFFLFWALLNVGLFLYFIFICLRATRRVWERVGLFAACLMVFGLLSFIGHSKTVMKQPTSNPAGRWVNDQEVYKSISPVLSVSKNLLKSPTFKISLDVQLGRDPESGQLVPLIATPVSNGVIAGFGCKPLLIYLSKTGEENIYSYHVNYNFAWTLLGLITYHEMRTFTGTIVLSDNPAVQK